MTEEKSRSTHFSRSGDGDVLDRLISSSLRDFLHSENDIHSFEDFTEDNVFTIQPRGLDGGDKELWREQWEKSVTRIRYLM